MYRNNYGPPRGRSGGGGGYRGGRGGGDRGFPPTGAVSAGGGEFVELLENLMKQPSVPRSSANSANNAINHDINANHVCAQPPPPVVHVPTPVVSAPTPSIQPCMQPQIQAVQSQIQAVKPPAQAPRQRFTVADMIANNQLEGGFNPAAPPFKPISVQFTSSAPANDIPRHTFAASGIVPMESPNVPILRQQISPDVLQQSQERASEAISNIGTTTTTSTMSSGSTFAASTPIRQDVDQVAFNPSVAFKELPIPVPDDLKNAIKEIESLTAVLDMVGKPEKLVVNEFYLVKIPGRNAYGRAQILHADENHKQAFVFFVDYVVGALVNFDMICPFPPYETWFIPPTYMKKTLIS